MSHATVYGKAELYEIAFDFRDVAAECDVLLELARTYSGRPAQSFIELAAGPAAHARDMAGRGLRSVAVDLSPEMVQLGRRMAREAAGDLEYIEADMTAFALSEPVDLAAMLMASEGYLLDNDAALAHLQCVADALVPRGIYVLEMGHPRDAFGVGRSADSDWVIERDGTTVHAIWGRDDDPFDPITQITDVTVTMSWQQGEDRGEITEIAPERRFVPNELRALVTASGRFEIVAELGALDPDLPVNNEKESWRFIPILRRLP
jgi:SAM-dependent methyltransferase